MDNKQEAIQLSLMAYDKLEESGISEQFYSILSSVASERNGRFFGSFGNDSGFFIEFKYLHNNLTPVQIRFGIRRYKESFWSRIKNILKESWAIFRGYDSEFFIDLTPDNVTKLKDLLRFL